MLVGSVIVDDEMEIVTYGSVGVDFAQEPDELLMPVAWHAIADNLSVEHTQGGEQGGGAVALVIVSHRPAASLLHRQSRLCAVERLDLAFLVDTEDQGFIGRIEIQADDIGELLHKVLVSADRRFTQPLSFGHGTGAPMGSSGRGRMKRCLDDHADFFLGNPWNASGARSILRELQLAAQLELGIEKLDTKATPPSAAG